MQHLVVIGDAPDRRSGLGRICGDILDRVIPASKFHDARIRPILLGAAEDDPRAMRDVERFGVDDLLSYAACIPQSDELTVFTIYDPARCWGIAQAVEELRRVRPVDLWGYFAVDAEGPYADGAFAGPGAEALLSYTRILAYTEFGARVLTATLMDQYPQEIPHLPHGLGLAFERDAPMLSSKSVDRSDYGWIGRWVSRAHQLNQRIIGAVASNQPRKDWGWFFSAIRLLNKQTQDFAVWVHTDRLSTAAWNFHELAQFAGIERDRLLITGGEAQDDLHEGSGGFTDVLLAWLYRQCWVTVAPGLGEGFGYPIIESQALGVPCIGVDYAGGAELGLSGIAPALYRLEGAYLLQRPVMNAYTLMGRLNLMLDDECRPGDCREAATTRPFPTERSPYSWDKILPAWVAWMNGLRG